jgi:hypothetical protein
VNFSGPAYQFGPPLYRRGASRRRLGRALVAALLVAFFVFLIQVALGRF